MAHGLTLGIFVSFYKIIGFFCSISKSCYYAKLEFKSSNKSKIHKHILIEIIGIYLDLAISVSYRTFRNLGPTL